MALGKGLSKCQISPLLAYNVRNNNCLPQKLPMFSLFIRLIPVLRGIGVRLEAPLFNLNLYACQAKSTILAHLHWRISHIACQFLASKQTQTIELFFSGKYTDEVVKRLLYLKKLDGFPVIREVEEEEAEEVSGTMDLQEIDRMANNADEDDAEEDPEKPVVDDDYEYDDEETRAPSDTEAD